MLEKLINRPDIFEFVETNQIETNRDGFIISGEDLELIERTWLNAHTDESDNWEHPNNYFDYINCYFDGENGENLSINLLLDRSSRFHAIKKLIPKNKIIASFIPYTMENHQYTVVDKDWFSFIRGSLYSSYALVDFIGIRKLISEHGLFPTETINILKKCIDDFAKSNNNYLFLTCADNIIVKTNWQITADQNNYTPENFILLINQLIEEIENKTGLKSYAIVTQGANYLDELNLERTEQSQNHFFIPSIAVPFIEAFEIDKDARNRIRTGELAKCRYYIENSFYISLRRKYYSSEEPEWLKFNEFTNTLQQNQLKYIGVSFEQLNELVKL